MASGQPPFFYHILMNPSSPHLPLPLKFAKKHLRNKILKNPILKSANGGYSWKLKMKKFDDHTFCFVNGWCNVVKDVGLLFGEFLLFKYVGSGVFLMHVYSVNGCEKILVPRINNFKAVDDDEVSVFEEDDDDNDDDVEYDVEEDDEDVAEEDEEDDDVDVEVGDDNSEDGNDGEGEDDVDIDGDDGDPFFVITSSKRNKNKLRFPPDLVALAKIKTKETITLKNDDGHEKVMPVRSYKQNKLTRYYVAEGWEEFQQSNNISEGDECVLKFITSEDKLCLAKVTKKRPRATEVDNDDDCMDNESEAENAKEDDSNVDGDDIFDVDVSDEGKGENAKHVNDDKDDDEDDHDTDGDDGDPSFILTSTKKNQYHLWFKADFVALAGINIKKTITLKNLDGYEKELRVRSNKRKRSIRYHLNAGWIEFQRNSNILEGDQFLFKFIKSEDKFCVAKITKEKTRARPLPPAAEPPVTQANDGIDDDDRDVDGDDGDPSFILTCSDTNQYKLRFSADFVALAGINTKETITLKNVDGYEKVLRVRSLRRNQSNNYYLAKGWKAFKRNSNISEGDKLVFKFITSEDKFCVAKITEKKTPAAEAPLTEVDDGMDEEGEAEDAKEDDSNDDGDDIFDDDMDDEGKGENAELLNNEEGDEDEDDDRDVDGDDGDPSFILTISDKNQYRLRFSADFAASARINTKRTITLKNLDGYEKELYVQSYNNKSHGRNQRKYYKYYYLSEGWKKFQRNCNISKGDKFVFKFITSEDKFCLAKITKEKTQARPLPPATETPVTQANNGMDDQDDDDDDDDGDPSFVLTSTEKNQYKLYFSKDFVELAKIDTKETITLKNLDGYEKELHVRSHRRGNRYYLAAGWKEFLLNCNISEGDRFVFKFIKSEDKFCVAKFTKKKTQARPLPPVIKAPVVDPFFVVDIITTHKFMLWLPPDFVDLAGIDGKKTIIIKCLDGNEMEMVLRPVKQLHATRYCFSMGWSAFRQSNNLSEGDKFVFKYITSEEKMSVAKISKKITPPTEVDDSDLKVADGKDVVVDDDEDENGEPVDDVMDSKDVVVDDYKDEDENVEPLDDGMDGKDGKDVVVDDNKDADENVELVDDVMDGKDVMVDGNKDGDENVELVDDGMDEGKLAI